MMPLLSDKFKNSSLSLILLGLIFSCTPKKSEQANLNFLKQYQGDVKSINARRDEVRVINKELSRTDKNWKNTREIFNIDNTESYRTANIDTSLLLLPEVPEEFLPNLETFVRGRTAGLPDDMFMVSYNTENFPYSYGRPRLSFDDINIPTKDYFGVETDLGEKNYQLVGQKSLQRDIDFTKTLIEKDDPEISLELIRQEKEAKRKKYLEEKMKEKKDLKEQEKSEDENKANEEVKMENETSSNE